MYDTTVTGLVRIKANIPFALSVCTIPIIEIAIMITPTDQIEQPKVLASTSPPF